MFQNLIGLIILLAIAVGLWWLVRWAWRRQNKIGKFGGTVGFGLFAVLLSLITVLVGMGMWTVYAPRGNDVVEANVAGTAEQIARGGVIVNSLCSGCHSLDGGIPSGNTNLLADIPMPLGDAWPPNLTPAGRISEWTDGELQRAIREGTDPDGHRLAVMSGQTFRYFSQDDLDAIVAYLRSLPATENDIGEPKQQLSTLAMIMATIGMLPIKDQPESNVPPPAVPIAPNAAYGEYIVAFTDCVLCHGDDLGGGAGGILPAGPSLASVGGWGADGFITAMRTGNAPGGYTIDPDEMPWESIGKLGDTELTAIYEHLAAYDY